jgi:hypothetical protein
MHERHDLKLYEPIQLHSSPAVFPRQVEFLVRKRLKLAAAPSIRYQTSCWREFVNDLMDELGEWNG